MRNHSDYSVVVFPFLKTEEAVSIGELSFRSTEDTAGLTAEQSETVNEIASMLFLRDNLRLRSASYAIVAVFTGFEGSGVWKGNTLASGHCEP